MLCCAELRYVRIFTGMKKQSACELHNSNPTKWVNNTQSNRYVAMAVAVAFGMCEKDILFVTYTKSIP